MKKSLIMATALAAFAAAPAVAADMAARPYTKAPIAVAPPFTWTGCYVGANVGYGWSRATDTDNLLSNYFLGQPVQVNGGGFVGGGQVGCDYQFAPNFVAGIEGTLSGASISNSATVIGVIPGAGNLSVNAYSKTEMLSTITGRVGYSFGTSLLYMKGGVAWAKQKYGGDWSVAVIGGPTVAGSVSANPTRTGWVIGGGYEYAFARNWSAMIEYNYMGFGTSTVTFPVTGIIPVGTSYIGNISQNIQTVTVGINYRF